MLSVRIRIVYYVINIYLFLVFKLFILRTVFICMIRSRCPFALLSPRWLLFCSFLHFLTKSFYIFENVTFLFRFKSNIYYIFLYGNFPDSFFLVKRSIKFHRLKALGCYYIAPFYKMFQLPGYLLYAAFLRVIRPLLLNVGCFCNTVFRLPYFTNVFPYFT